MKRLTNPLLHILLIHLILFMGACGQSFEQVPDEQADKEQISIARTITDEYFKVLEEGGTYDFTGKATAVFIKSFTPEAQRKSHEQMTSQFGTFESMEYAETWTNKVGSELTIVRFKAKFSKTEADLEVRVVLDSQNMVGGFWMKPWQDEL